jgi:hypothetical protein
MQFDNDGILGSLQRAQRQLEEMANPAREYLKWNDGILGSARRAQRELEELIDPSRAYLKQLDSARELAEEIGASGNRYGHLLAYDVIQDSLAAAIEPSRLGVHMAAEDALASALKFNHQRAQVPESVAQAMAGDFLDSSSNAYARLAETDLVGIRAIVDAIGRHQSALGSFDHVVAGLDRIGIGGTPRAIASHLALDQRDLMSYADRYCLGANARTQWLDDMSAYSADLETFAQSVRLQSAPNLDVFNFAEKLLGRFDETAQSALENAQTADDRIQAYLSLGADPRLLRVPRKIFRRKARIVTRTAIRLLPKPSDFRSQVERQIYRSDFVEDLPRLYARCRVVLAQLRSFVDQALTNLYGPSWVQSRVPRAIFAAWVRSARRESATPATGVAWLELADESELITLITSHWDEIFDYRIDESASFIDSIRVLGQLQRQMARMPKAMTKFDELRLSVAATEVAKSLRHMVPR